MNYSVMNLTNDIPERLARTAFYGTSHTPDERGDQTRKGYAETLASDYYELSQYADTEEKIITLNAAFERYRAGYKERMIRYLHSQSRCMSSFIVGPAKFPVRQQEKRHKVVDAHLKDLIEFRKKALKAIERDLRPEIGPIMSSDGDAIERLKLKLQEAEKHQKDMKATNDAWRSFERKKDPSKLLSLGLSQSQIDDIAEKMKDAYSWERQPYPAYMLSNNNANIKRIKGRIKQVTATQSEPVVSVEGEKARFEDCPADNRVRLFFPDKPSVEIRERLKKNGFRWSPSIGVWQAYRNYKSIEIARSIAAIGAAEAETAS
jgi:hypothetical protein